MLFRLLLSLWLLQLPFVCSLIESTPKHCIIGGDTMMSLISMPASAFLPQTICATSSILAYSSYSQFPFAQLAELMNMKINYITCESYFFHRVPSLVYSNHKNELHNFFDSIHSAKEVEKLKTELWLY